MGKLMIDERTADQMSHLNEETEITSPSGETVGYFTPKSEYLRSLYEWALSLDTKDIREASMRSYEEHGGVSTAEALAHVYAKHGYPENDR